MRNLQLHVRKKFHCLPFIKFVLTYYLMNDPRPTNQFNDICTFKSESLTTALNGVILARWLTGTSLSKGKALRTAVAEGTCCIRPPEWLSGYSARFHFWQESC